MKMVPRSRKLIPALARRRVTPSPASTRYSAPLTIRRLADCARPVLGTGPPAVPNVMRRVPLFALPLGALINRGIAVFDELRQGIKDIEFLADPTAGELRIGTSEDLAAGLVLAVVKRLSQKYPRMVFHVVTSVETSLLSVLTERNVELMI